jgi:hypothetical protein
VSYIRKSRRVDSESEANPNITIVVFGLPENTHPPIFPTVQVPFRDRNHPHMRLGMIMCKSLSLDIPCIKVSDSCGDRSNNDLTSAPIGTFDPSNKIHPSTSHLHETPLSNFMLHDLCFLRYDDLHHITSPNDLFRIPDISPYVPHGTDLDVAATLTAIYRSHCTSLVECVRYMRLKQFHQLFVSFHGTLTAPVQKLLSVPSLAPWIRESDWAMYKA